MWPLCSNTQEMLRPDIPSPQLHSFPVTETEPEDNLTLSSRCAWLFIRTGLSVPVPPPDAGGVKHWRLLMLVITVQEEKREEEKMGEVEARGKKKRKGCMNSAASWNWAHVESHSVMINRAVLSVCLLSAFHRPLHGQRLYRGVWWVYV